jgi:hypothetical protein
VTVVVYEKFFSEALCGNFKAFGTIRSEADYFTNDPIARDFDRSKVAFWIKCRGETTRARRH